MQTPSTKLAHEADFTTFMRAYQDMVYSTAARLTGNPMQAEDIAQHVFLKAYENFDNLRGPEAGGWLKTVVRRTALNHLQRYRNRWKFFSELRHENADDDAPDFEIETPDTLIADLDIEENRARVERALQELPDNYRVPLVLYHFEELSYEDIATQLGASLSKVKTDIFRGPRRDGQEIDLTHMQNDGEKLERFIDRTLRDQPPLRAPSALETRVLHELTRLAALPWWRKSFAHWPLAARALFVMASGVFIKLALTGADWMSDAAAAPVASVQSKARFASSLMEAGAALVHAIPAQWLYAGLAFGAFMYVLLFGIGATAYRTLYK